MRNERMQEILKEDVIFYIWITVGILYPEMCEQDIERRIAYASSHKTSLMSFLNQYLKGLP